MIAGVADWWHRNITEPGKLPLLATFASFVVTFAVTRSITRMIRAGVGPFKDNVSSGGLHVHHAVPGIMALVTGAFVAVGTTAGSSWHLVAAVLIGAGTSLVLDEFALILHLEDVYWTDEGRVSVEMVSLAFGCLGLAVVGAAPFGVDEIGGGELAARTGTIVASLVTIVLVVVCVMKGKFRLALFGVFVPGLAWVGAVRLARPTSRWARRRYDQVRRQRATARTAAFDARWDPFFDRLSDLIAGKPSAPDP
jgi:hypothetical protein